MEQLKIVSPKLLISVILFFLICLIGSLSEANSKNVLSSSSSIHLVSVENDTDNCEFQLFYGSHNSLAYVFAQSVFRFNPEQAIALLPKDQLIIKCSKGSFLPVFVQNGGIASGDAPEGYQGPFYISMWLGYPQMPETSKTHIRYVVKTGTIGTIGIKIGQKGDYRFVAHDNINFIF